MKSNVSSAFRALYARLKTVRSKSLSVMLTPILVLNLLPVGLMPGSTEELGNEAGDVAIVSVEETDDLADEQAVEAIPDEQEQSQFTDPELAPMNEPVIEVLDNPPELVDSEDYLTVTYDANGGFTSIVDKGEYEALDTVLVQFSPTPIRDGYEFLGWVDDLSATEVLYALEDDDGETSFVIGDNVTLYAFWDESDFMAIGPLAIGDPHTVTLATGIGSDDPDITYIALEGEKIGDIDDFDASPPTAKAGYAFVGWEPVIDPETVVYNDLVFTAQWIQDFTTPGPSIQHNWSSVLGSPAFGGYQIPGNAQRLDFNDVSNSGQTYLDYAFLVMDNEGNATIIFLTLTRGEDPDYVNYLGINATQKANYTSGNGGNKITYTAWELTLTPAMIATISTGGTLSGTFTYWVGNGGNSINGQTLTFSNLSYTVEHYIYDGVDLGTAVYKLTTPGVGLPGQTVTGNPINIFGYEYDDLASAATKTGTIPPTGGLVLKLYYKPTGTFLWEITGINETIEYDGNEHSLLSVNGGILSDLFQCSFPNDGDYRFEGSLTLVNPVGTDPDTYNQNLYPVIGSYTIWYDGPNKTTGIDGEEDVTDRMGPPQVFNGSLVITQSTAAITIHTPDDTKPYDGTALENHNYTVTGLPNGYTLTAVIDGSQTDVGFSDNTIDSYYITRDSDGAVVTGFFAAAQEDLGTLTVTPKVATVTANSDSKYYAEDDPSPFALSYSGFLHGDEPVTGDYFIARPGAGTDEAVGTYAGALVVTDAGTYTNPNYSVTLVYGDFEILRNPIFDNVFITVTGNSATYTFDGAQHSVAGYTVSSLLAGFAVTAVASGATATNATTTPVPNTISNVVVTYNGFNVTSLVTVNTINGSLTILPLYLTVTFIDWNGAVLSTQSVIYGGNATAPANPTRAGYTFTGWNRGFTNITTNITVQALYAVIVTPPPAPTTYTVSYAPGDHGTFAAETTSGLTAGSATPAAPAPAGEDGWVFTGWSPEPAATVTGNATYTAQWERASVTVTFLDYDGSVIKEEELLYGESATAPDDPEREGYDFNGWDRAFTNVTEDIDVMAKYNPHSEVVIDLPPTPTTNAWALVNLILCIVGALVAVIVLIRAFSAKRKDEDEKTGDTEQTKNRNIFVGLTIVLAIIGVIFFFITEDMRNPMIMIDRWTIVNLIILLVELIVTFFAFRRKTTEGERPRTAAAK